MSEIQKMIEEMCPDGVEYSPLGKLGVFFRGNGLQKKDFSDEIRFRQGFFHSRPCRRNRANTMRREAAFCLSESPPFIAAL